MTITAQRDVEAAAAAAQCVVRVHERLVDFLQPGLTLAEIDRYVAVALDDLECTSAFLRYRIRGHPPFPSYACLSLNNCIVHGTHEMTSRAIVPGDLLSIDIGVKHHGWVGDAAWTYAIESASDEALALMSCGRESLRRGIAAIRAGRPLVDWARAVQDYVEKTCGYHLVRGLGGHGYGRQLHGPPFLANTAPTYPGEWPEAWKPFTPGMLLAVEPMIAIGTGAIRSQPSHWPIFTADGSLAVHYEADVLVTEEGPRDLTDGMDALPDIVGR
jgi:methionyl aminopeptidase